MTTKSSEREEARRSLLYETNGHRVICELLRLVYDEVYGCEDTVLKERMTKLLVNAFIAAKKMDARLQYYHETYGDTTGHHGHHLRRIAGTAERRKMRRER